MKVMKSRKHSPKTPSKKAAAEPKYCAVLANMFRSAWRASRYAFLAGAGIWLPKADAATLINLDVTTLPLGPASTLTNTGTLGLAGNFNSSGAVVPGVSNIDGVSAVAMLNLAGNAGPDNQYIGPATPAALGGANPRTIEAWIFDPGPGVTAQAQPQIQFEKTILSFGRRFVPNGNFVLEHGRSTDIGAVSTGAIETEALGGIGWGGEQNVLTNNWTYIVATYDGQTLSVYSDGVLRNSETYAPYVNAIKTALRSSDSSTNTFLRIARQSIDNAGATPSGQGIGPFYLGRLRVQDTNMTAAQVLAQF